MGRRPQGGRCDGEPVQRRLVHLPGHGRWTLRASTESAQHLARSVPGGGDPRAGGAGGEHGVSARDRLQRCDPEHGSAAGRPAVAAGDGWDGTLVLDGRTDGQGAYLQGHGPKVLVDGRVSLYSLWGDVFAWIVCLGGRVSWWCCCGGQAGRATPRPVTLKGER